MGFDEHDFSELQEMLFWRCLFYQLLNISGQDKIITEDYLQFVQSACLGNKIFSKVSLFPFSDEIELSIYTDGERHFFVNCSVKQWATILKKCLQGIIILNADECLANVYERITEYDKTENIIEPDEYSDKDEEMLAKVHNHYFDYQDKLRWEPVIILKELYKLKAIAILEMLETANINDYIIIKDEKLCIDLPARKRNQLNQIYNDLFIDPTKNIVKPLLDSELLIAGLGDAVSMHDDNQIVQEFYEYERDLIESVYENARIFIDRLSVSPDRNIIEVCSLRAFEFINNPFPLV